MRLIIPGTLPSLNEIIDAAKGHWNNYREMKIEYTNLVHLSARNLPVLQHQVDVTITWYCPDRRRDKDNIMAGQKFIFDGLQQAKKINNDGWKQIRNVTHRFEVDHKEPRVEVEIMEIGEATA
jgi:Holliday junction resolvase RusA-like endonuclease